MIHVEGSQDCGNSPKNKFVQDVAVALKCGDAEPGAFSDDVIWENSSTQPISGKSAVLELLENRWRLSSVTVHHAMSHGKVGAASGEVMFENGQTRRFCHVSDFTSAKANCVAVIRSYS